MSDQFLGEIRMAGFNFAPIGWAFCNGQTLPISQYTALFSLLGITYGGNGQSTFCLPNLQGNVAMDFGNGPGLTSRDLGETGGVTDITLLSTQMAMHTHFLVGDTDPGGSTSPANTLLGKLPVPDREPVINVYKTGALTTPVTLTNFIGVSSGASKSHSNVQPYLVVNFIIAMQGVFPTRP